MPNTLLCSIIVSYYYYCYWRALASWNLYPHFQVAQLYLDNPTLCLTTAENTVHLRRLGTTWHGNVLFKECSKGRFSRYCCFVVFLFFFVSKIFHTRPWVHGVLFLFFTLQTGHFPEMRLLNISFKKNQTKHLAQARHQVASRIFSFLSRSRSFSRSDVPDVGNKGIEGNSGAGNKQQGTR